ncbi:MAG: hypothetical protein AVDCRST_MAG30-1363, partial [uncultured Solirubrobacteraceae bacterium]
DQLTARDRRRLRHGPHRRLRDLRRLLRRDPRPAVHRPLRPDAGRRVPGRQPHARRHGGDRLRAGVPAELHADRPPGRRRGGGPCPPRGEGRGVPRAVRQRRVPPGDLQGSRRQPAGAAPPLRAAEAQARPSV